LLSILSAGIHEVNLHLAFAEHRRAVSLPHNLQLVTPRLILRPWRESDRAPYAAMNADPAVMTFFASTMTPTESDASLARFQAAYDRDGFGFLVAELRSNGAFAGIIGAQTMRDAVPNLPQPAVEIGWRLPLALHGQGLATEGARATVDFCFNQFNLPEVVAVTAFGNRASRHVMEKLGMTYRPDLDFDHPRMPSGHQHQRHALYQLRNLNAPKLITEN
jgi:RimJ/RimL family protein N-acetyltransferase